MLKKIVTYKDFEEKERIEDVYFNLTKSELIEFALDLPDSVSGSVGDEPEKMDEQTAATKVTSALGSKGMFKFIKDLILKSYGVKKDEGRRFAKTDENGKPLYIEFSQTMVFETIMNEFMTDDLAASDFVNAIIPSSLSNKMKA